MVSLSKPLVAGQTPRFPPETGSREPRGQQLTTQNSSNSWGAPLGRRTHSGRQCPQKTCASPPSPLARLINSQQAGPSSSEGGQEQPHPRRSWLMS